MWNSKNNTQEVEHSSCSAESFSKKQTYVKSTIKQTLDQPPKYDIICIGTALVDSIILGFDPNPISVSGYRAESSALHVGGEAVNVAAAAAKLGLRTAIVCFLGEDAAGELVAEALRRSGVDTGWIERSAAHPTPVTTMFVREDGTRKSITNGAHRYNFHPERCMDCFSQTRAIVLGSLFRAPFDDVQVLSDVLHKAKACGIPVFADTKLPNFHPLALRDLAGLLPLVDYITPNEDEARYFTGKDTPEQMAEEFLRYGVKNVIIKLGGRGCYYRNPELRLPAFEIEAVDATGAGDNFLAGFVSEILRGAAPAEALRFANACGAICATASGAGTALIDRAQVCAFLAEHP